MMAIGSVRKAVLWVNEQIEQDPLADKKKLIDEASQQCDLSPAETQNLTNEIEKNT